MTVQVLDLRTTKAFDDWLDDLRDIAGRKAIRRRIARINVGAFGDSRSVGGTVSELRIDVGPGYRVYFTRRGRPIVLLLCGGDKDSQPADIARARSLAAKWSGPDGP